MILDEQIFRGFRKWSELASLLLPRHFYFWSIETRKQHFSMQIECPQAFLCSIYDQIIFFNVFGTQETIGTTWLADSAMFLVHAINLGVNLISKLYSLRLLAIWSLNFHIWCNLIQQMVIACYRLGTVVLKKWEHSFLCLMNSQFSKEMGLLKETEKKGRD